MSPSEITIVPYDERYRADFERLNRAWVSTHFVVEPSDEEEWNDPYNHFVADGGQILFLLTPDQEVIGTVAIAQHGPNEFELAKMTISEEHRGKGYGDRLLEAAIAFARTAKATSLLLVSNTSLTSAIRLYEKHGFRSIPLDPQEEYRRANIRMRLTL